MRRVAVSLVVGLLCGCAPASPEPVALPSPPPARPSPTPSPEPSIYPVPSPTPARPPGRGTPPQPSADPVGSSVPPAPVTQAPGGIACGEVASESYRGTQVEIETTCFEVRGTTLGEIQSSIEESGPRVDDYRRAGATRWRVRWSYEVDASDASCAMAGSDVTTTISYLLPDWRDAASASPEVVDGYAAFARDVVRHEQVHGRIAKQAGAAVLDAVATTPASPTCEDVAAQARQRVDAVMDTYRAKQAAFDRREAGG